MISQFATLSHWMPDGSFFTPSADLQNGKAQYNRRLYQARVMNLRWAAADSGL